MVILFALRYEREGRPQVNQLLEMLSADGNQQHYTVRAFLFFHRRSWHI